MQQRPYQYLVFLQYLGLRYRGWQKQAGQKTVQGQLERVIRFVLGHEEFTVLGAGRTDSGVSAAEGAFALHSAEQIHPESFLQGVNAMLPADILLLRCQEVPLTFNIIQDVEQKEYRYYFRLGAKPAPLESAYQGYFAEDLALEALQAAALLFEGTHDFRCFCPRQKTSASYVRTIFQSRIVALEPTEKGNFNGYYQVRGTGFLMHQVRMMLGALLAVGRGEKRAEDLKAALQTEKKEPFAAAVPAHGLVLHRLHFRGL
ncbi:tRNA pseudouridine(38-40) synthase TruA [Nitritalea halalkaliphila]|nr:tRNA pseudouridine(38-40) synthase TruA [Nitritalea halalkaliphila]